MIMTQLSWDPRVFLIVVGVNIITVVYSLLPLPSLAGGALVCELLPPAWSKARSIFVQAGPFLIIALVLLERLQGPGFPSRYFDPVKVAIFHYLRGF